MAEHVIAPPAARVLPVTAGCDRAFTVQHAPAGQLTDFPAGATVRIAIDIDRDNPTIIDATVERCNAAIRIPANICDQVRTGTRYRVLLDLGSVELPLVVGTFQRFDG